MKKLITLSLVAFLGLFSIAPMVGCTGGDDAEGDNTEENGGDDNGGEEGGEE